MNEAPSPERIRALAEASERTAKYLRTQLALWRAEEEKAEGRLKQLRKAFFWSVQERWFRRIEDVAAAFDNDAAILRGQEVSLKNQPSKPFLKRIFK